MKLPAEMGGTYRTFRDTGHEGDGADGGISGVAQRPGVSTHWLYYITVDDLDAALKRVKDKGGEVLNGPMEVPGGDRVAQCHDPEGAAFALYWRKPSAT
jgi:predicted enzyme related to lactoylglutathione lyase